MRKLARYSVGFQGNPIRIAYTFTSTNIKTGDVIQQWITPAAWQGKAILNHKDIVKSGEVCNECPLLKTCYVKKGMTAMGLRSTSKSANHIVGLEQDNLHLFKDRFMRFGAFGEPVLAGEEILKEISQAVENWTGYTHQWRESQYQWAKEYLMASCSLADYEQAWSMGWRVYLVLQLKEQPPKGFVNCPASKEAGRKTTCSKCKLCRGNDNKGKSVYTYKH